MDKARLVNSKDLERSVAKEVEQKLKKKEKNKSQ